MGYLVHESSEFMVLYEKPGSHKRYPANCPRDKRPPGQFPPGKSPPPHPRGHNEGTAAPWPIVPRTNSQMPPVFL